MLRPDFSRHMSPRKVRDSEAASPNYRGGTRWLRVRDNVKVLMTCMWAMSKRAQQHLSGIIPSNQAARGKIIQ